MLRKILHSRSNTDTSYFDDTGSRVNNEYLEESEGDSSKNHTRETYVRDKIPEPRSYTKKKLIPEDGRKKTLPKPKPRGRRPRGMR